MLVAWIAILHQTKFVSKGDRNGTGFCDASFGSVMYEGFQLAIGRNRPCALLLFQPWLLSSAVKYAFAFVGVVLLAASLEGLGEYRDHLQQLFYRRYGVVTSDAHYISVETPVAARGALASSASASFAAKAHDVNVTLTRRLPLWCKLVLAGFYMLVLAIAYLLMLVIMMYESALFVAVVLGLGLGFFLFKDTEADKMGGNVDPCCST